MSQSEPLGRMWHYRETECFIYKLESGWWVTLVENSVLVKREHSPTGPTAIDLSDEWADEFGASAGLVFVQPARQFHSVASVQK